jgi:hypothetical protein
VGVVAGQKISGLAGRHPVLSRCSGRRRSPANWPQRSDGRDHRPRLFGGYRAFSAGLRRPLLGPAQGGLRGRVAGAFAGVMGWRSHTQECLPDARQRRCRSAVRRRGRVGRRRQPLGQRVYPERGDRGAGGVYDIQVILPYPRVRVYGCRAGPPRPAPAAIVSETPLVCRAIPRHPAHLSIALPTVSSRPPLSKRGRGRAPPKRRTCNDRGHLGFRRLCE